MPTPAVFSDGENMNLNHRANPHHGAEKLKAPRQPERTASKGKISKKPSRCQSTRHALGWSASTARHREQKPRLSRFGLIRPQIRSNQPELLQRRLQVVHDFLRNHIERREVVWRAAALVCHFQKQQIGELLDVITVAHAVVAQDVALVPEFPDDGGAIHLRRFSFSPSSMAASMVRARSGS